MVSLPATTLAPGRVAYIERADDARQALAGMRALTELAIDTEGASYHRFLDRVYLLQLSTRDRDVIIDPLTAGNLPELVELLESSAIVKVLHDADYDLRLLRQDYGARIRNVFDTRVAAQLLGIRSFGLSALLDRYFGVKLDKQFQRADWSLRPLTPGMLDYAVEDTRHLLALRDAMTAELERAGRMSWAREEFERIEANQLEPPSEDSLEPFMRIKGARDLSRRELAILRSLVEWRDATARRMDRAMFRVIGNETLLDLSRVRPRSKGALGTVKGVPRPMLQRDYEPLLAAIASGEAVNEAELPRFQRAKRWDRDPAFEDRVNALRRVRDEAAAAHDIDAGVLCSRERLETIARLKPADVQSLREVPGFRKWQAEVLGERLLAAARG